MASLAKVQADMGKPVYVKNGVQIYFKVSEPKTIRGKRRIDVVIRVPNQRWRNHHLLQHPFGLKVQYVNVTHRENKL